MSWFTDICQSVSNEVAAATGAAYGAGALTVTGNPAIAGGVGEIISNTVEDGWSNGVCIAPGTIADAFSGGSGPSVQIDPVSSDAGSQPD